MASHEIILKDVSRFDAKQLKHELDGNGVQIDEGKIPEGGHGDLGLSVVTVIITLAALKVVGAYLLRKHGEESWTAETESADATGTRTIHRVIYRRNSSESPSKTVVDSLAKALNIDLSKLSS
jgi:hypothetical protein